MTIDMRCSERHVTVPMGSAVYTIRAHVVEKIRKHYESYQFSPEHEGDNRAAPVSGVLDASTFREVSTWYINRLLRYIEVEEWIHVP